MKYSKKIFIILTILTSLSACKQSILSKESYELSHDTLAFYKMKIQDTFNQTIHIRNLTDSIILVSKIETACGCTTAELSSKQIKPKDSIAVKISYIPKLANDIGFTEKYITFRTNSTPVFLNLTLKGEIEK